MRRNLLKILLLLIFIMAGCSIPLSRTPPGTKPVCGTSVAAVPDVKPPKQFCNLVVKIKIDDPTAPYLSDFGKVTVIDVDGVRESKRFPVKQGTQIVVFPDYEPGRYTVEVSYGNYIATKCVVLCCYCPDRWREVCLHKVKEQLVRKFNQPPDAVLPPDCSVVSPCGADLIFYMPDDAKN